MTAPVLIPPNRYGELTPIPDHQVPVWANLRATRHEVNVPTIATKGLDPAPAPDPIPAPPRPGRVNVLVTAAVAGIAGLALIGLLILATVVIL